MVYITRLITVNNYAEKMDFSLAPWPLDEKNLKANSVLRRVLITPADVPKYRHLINSGEADKWEKEENRIAVKDEFQPLIGVIPVIEVYQRIVADSWLHTKCPLGSQERAIVLDVQEKIGYVFANEWLIIQALTRRSFGGDNMMLGDKLISPAWYAYENYEALELIGDSIITASLYKMMVDSFSCYGVSSSGHRFTLVAPGNEGRMTKERERFSDRTYLGECCKVFGFDKYIRAGKGDDISGMGPKEDVIEALIGAVAIDCEWDLKVVSRVVDNLLEPQFEDGNEIFASEDDFDAVNRWHQKRYGTKAVFKTYPYSEEKDKELYEQVSQSGKMVLPHWAGPNGKEIIAMVDIPGLGVAIGYGTTKSDARTDAAVVAKEALVSVGRWRDDLKNCGFRPNLDDAINQLQELYQKKYLSKKPEYEFVEHDSIVGDTEWECYVYIGEDSDLVPTPGYGRTKVEAKKKAAFEKLIELFEEGGIKVVEEDDDYEDIDEGICAEPLDKETEDDLSSFLQMAAYDYGTLPLKKALDIWNKYTGEKVTELQAAQYCCEWVHLTFSVNHERLIEEDFLKDRERNRLLKAQEKYGVYIPTKEEFQDIIEFGYAKTDASRALEKIIGEDKDYDEPVHDIWNNINDGFELEEVKAYLWKCLDGLFLEMRDQLDQIIERMYEETMVKKFAGHSRKELRERGFKV
ncbi:MAG: hypothetical protein IJ088_07915 [Clostridia bacterium]|nr:hypothetical protein [Clostridia bacterium]